MTAFNTVYIVFFLNSNSRSRQEMSADTAEGISRSSHFQQATAENNAEQNEAADVGLNTANWIKGEKQHCVFIFSIFDFILYILIYTTDAACLQLGRFIGRI